MFSLDFILKGVVAPAVAAFVVALLLKRGSDGSRGVGAAAYAVGQTLGTVWMLYGSGDGFPTRNLHWVPWEGILAAAIGPTAVAIGLTALERWILTILAATAAAILLVPQWPDLWPPRLISIALFVLVAFSVQRLADRLTQRTSPRLIALAMAGTALFAAMLITASFSLRVGEAALITAAALSGTAVALMIWPDEMAVRGLCLPYVLAVGGWCYVTAIEPVPPLIALLFLPAALLVLWLGAVGPVSRWTSRPKIAVSVLLFLLTLAGIGAWAWFSTEHGEDEYASSPTRASSIDDLHFGR